MLALMLVFCFSAATAVGASVPAAKTEGLSAPAALTVKVDAIWRTLDRAAWIAERDASVKPNGKVLYAVTFRSCPTCAAFKAAEYDALLKAGVEIRWIMYARRDRDGKARSKPGERAMIAALWITRDADLMARWWAAEDLDAFYNSPDLPPAPEGDPQREGALAQSRATVESLSGLFADNGVDLAIPTLIWREGTQTRAYVGYTAAGFTDARAFLTAPGD
jgi:hypothetical protein